MSEKAPERGWRQRFGWWRRIWSSPAPELRPPGFSAPAPSRQGYHTPTLKAVERQALYDLAKVQVRGEARGVPSLLRTDWEQQKLKEARWIGRESKRAEAQRQRTPSSARRQRLSREQKPAEQSRALPSSRQSADAARDRVGDAFMQSLRDRAFERAARREAQNMAQNRDRERERDGE